MRLTRKHTSRGESPELFESLEPRQLLALATQTQIVASTDHSVMGQAVDYTATVTPNFGTGIPIGFVRFKDGATVLAQVPLDANGRASFTSYALFMGSHTVIARFIGSGVYKPSAASTALTVAQGPVTSVGAAGLQIATVSPGTGAGAAANQKLTVNYTGYLTDGTKFDSSLNPQRSPFTFTLGVKQVIDGWDQGMPGIKVGETRLLVIPPSLGYGAQGQGSIPGNATLYFIVQLLALPNTTTPLTVTGANAGHMVSAAPASTSNGSDFGAVQSGTLSTSTTFIVADSTTNFAFTQSLTVTGVNPRKFFVSKATQVAQGIWTITVAFDASALGFKRATLNIFTNDPTTPKFEVRIAGTSV